MRQAAALAAAALLGTSVGLVYSATAHEGCYVSGSSPQVWEGDEHAQYCYAGNGWDSMYGYGDNDTLGGELERDEIRGATGNDVLTDGKGNFDTDSVCDGDGTDSVNTADSDGRDVLRSSDGTFTFYSDQGDSASNVSSCPF